MKKDLYDTAKPSSTAILVAVATKRQPTERTREYLNELAFLAETMGVRTRKFFYQHLDKIDPKTFVGKGKLQDIALYAKEYDVDMVIFDDDLSTSHVRNLEKYLKHCLVIDRSLLILQIFMRRAQTAQAKTQVELAQYQYMLPRLTNLWTHHSRQKGGIGMRGPGETELETDKRIIRDKISLLKKKLEKISQQSIVRKKLRERMVRVSLVGYTNVGKSTLMRLLAKKEVFAENKLFATVDSTVRKITWRNIPFLLTDTVGFIRKLPTTLIDSFQSTLSEIVEADILLHVIDIAHTSFHEHIAVVDQTLKDIGAESKPTLLVFNKIDNYQTPTKEHDLPFEQPQSPITIEDWKQHYFSLGEQAVFISATNREYIDELKESLFQQVQSIYYKIYPNHKQYNFNQY